MAEASISTLTDTFQTLEIKDSDEDSWTQSAIDAITKAQQLMTLLNVNEPMSAIRKLVKDEDLFCGIKLSGKGRTKALIIKEINDIITKKNEEEFQDLKKKSTKLIHHFLKKLNEQKQKNSEMLPEMNKSIFDNNESKIKTDQLMKENEILKQHNKLLTLELNSKQNIDESLNQNRYEQQKYFREILEHQQFDYSKVAADIEKEVANHYGWGLWRRDEYKNRCLIIGNQLKQNSELKNGVLSKSISVMDMYSMKTKEMKEPEQEQSPQRTSYSTDTFSAYNTHSSINKCRHNL